MVKSRFNILLFIIFIILLIPTVQAIDQFENPGFETGDLSNWTVVGWGGAGSNDAINTNARYSGTYGLQTAAWSHTPGTKGRKFYQNLYLTGVGKVNFYYKINDSDDGIELFSVGIDGVEKWNTTGPVGGWIYKSVDISGYSGYHDVEFMIWVDGCGPPTPFIEIYLDDVSLDVGEYTLSGYVKNNYGNTVSSANINLNASGGSTTSNDTGYYELTGVECGTYSITATSPTNEDYSDTVSITTNTEKNITMTRLSPLLTWTDAETTMNDVFLKWRRNAIVDKIRIYKDTETRLLTTVSSGSYLSGLYSDRNLDCDTGYVYWLQPMDNDVAGPKYRIDAKTDPCDGGGGGGGDPTPTPSPTATPGPTPPPWTNITPEEWLNLTLDQKQEILANLTMFPPLLEFQWEDIYVWGIHLFLILCGAVALDSITIQKVSEYTGLWAILPGVMFAYLTGYLVI